MQSLCMKNCSNNGLRVLETEPLPVWFVEPDLVVDRPGRDEVLVGTGLGNCSTDVIRGTVVA